MRSFVPSSLPDFFHVPSLFVGKLLFSSDQVGDVLIPWFFLKIFEMGWKFTNLRAISPLVFRYFE
jgi:hypothetical protein